MARRRALAVLVLALVLAAPPAGRSGPHEAAAPAASPDADLAEIERICDERNTALGKALGEGNDALAQLDAMLAAAESDARAAPAVATAATGRPAAAVVDGAKEARESLKVQIGAAEALRAQAAEALAFARRERDPVKKVEHLRASIDLSRKSSETAQAALSALRPAPHRRPAVTGNSHALAQARALAEGLQNAEAGSPRLAVLSNAYDGAARRAADAVAPGPGTPYFSGAPRAYANGTLTLADGRRIDVSAAEGAAAGGGPRRPLFREVPAPDGGTRPVVNPAVFNRANAADARVGGVALQVTFLALEAAGVPGFRGGAPLEGIEQTVLVSLQRLQARAQPYASDAQRWASLPEELRFPGGIERIVGYVLDPSRRDVVLIASPAQRPRARMDIDAIVLALRVNWRDDAVATVSLDPSPLAPFGPQLSRVGGVPHDSVPAKIMLDADYMMKEIMIGKRQTALAGYRTLVALTQANPALAAPSRARFWFYPKPLGAESVAAAGSGRTVTFNAELQVLTEQMTLQGASFVGTGGAGSLQASAASEFTRALDALAGSAGADPQAMFARLRGLGDAATLGALLRRAGVDYPVLAQLSGLPHRRLEGAEAPPRHYPGIATEFDVRGPGGRQRMVIGGGVELASRPRRPTRASALDAFAAQLERVVDGGEPQRRDAVPQPLPAVFARLQRAGADARADAAFDRGAAAFQEGRFADAVREFGAAAQLDRSFVEAQVHLAFSLDRLGRNGEARQAIRIARRLDPDDAQAQLVEYAIRLRTERSWLGLEDPVKTLRRLIALYTANARSALNRGEERQAHAWASDAIDLGLAPAAVEAYLVRGLAGLSRDLDQGCADVERAWGETRYVLSGGAYDDDEKLHAFASLAMAECSTRRAIRALERGTPGPALFRALAADRERTAELLRPVQRLFPDHPGLLALEVMMEASRYALLEPEMEPAPRAREQRRLLSLAERAGRRFPDDPDVLSARADALGVLGRCADARGDLRRARQDARFRGVPADFISRCGAP